MTLTQIIDTVCATLGIDKAEFMSPCRRRELADARKIYCIIASETTKLSYENIGRAIGRNHSTVSHCIIGGKCLNQGSDEFSVMLSMCRNAVRLIVNKDAREKIAFEVDCELKLKLQHIAFDRQETIEQLCELAVNQFVHINS